MIAGASVRLSRLFRTLTCAAPAFVALVTSPLSLSGQESCPDGRISSVLVTNKSVFDTDSAEGGRFTWAYRLANALHVQTREHVIGRELLFRTGDCYELGLLRDSERLLRAFSFLADATVVGIRQPDGDVQVVVETQDEWSTRIEPRFGSGSTGLRGVSIVEDNLVGTGRHLSVFYDDDVERVYGITYATPHLFRTRWNLGVRFARTDAGYSYRESITYPFLGETGRFAFRHRAGRDERHFEVLMPEGPSGLSALRVPLRRDEFEIGAAVRWGRQRYRHTVLGVALAAERIEYPAEPFFASSEERSTTAAHLLADGWTPVSSARLMMLTGQSNIYYVRRRGLDTLHGTEDVRLGVEAEASFGPTLPGMSRDRDIAVGLGLFAAGEPFPEIIAGARFSFDARRSYQSIEDLPEWNDVAAEADAWAYLRPSLESRHLLVASISGAAGWHPRVPFQLTLGGDAGLRGYARHVDPGGRRVVGALEYRAKPAWPAPELFDFGTVLFLDVGKIWSGDVPFGTNSPVRAAAGVGIRAAFPPGSRQTFRLDVGYPLDGHTTLRSAVVSIGIGQIVGRGAVGRDPQLLRSARYGLSTAHFVVP